MINPLFAIMSVKEFENINIDDIDDVEPGRLSVWITAKK